MIFSEKHAWQGDVAVQQILAFSSIQNEENFKLKMDQRFKSAFGNYAGVDQNYAKEVKDKLSDSDAGAIYKLRSVKNGNDAYDAVIRCGFDGGFVWESLYEYKSPDLALSACLNQLVVIVGDSVKKFVHPVASKDEQSKTLELWATSQETGKDLHLRTGPRKEILLEVKRMNDAGRDYWTQEYWTKEESQNSKESGGERAALAEVSK